MRVLQRVLATTVATLALAAAGATVAVPANASPEDGKGCVGSPSIPASYVCVISVTPENVVPTTSTTIVPVTVPSVCYFLDCTAPTTVDVPVPNVSPRSGVVAVLWYQGVYYPIAVGTIDAMDLVADTIDLATGVAYTALGLAIDLANLAIGIVEREAAEAIQTVEDIVNGLPTLQEILDAISRYIEEQVQPVVDEWTEVIRELIRQIREWDPTQEPVVQELLERVRQVVEAIQECLRVCIAPIDIS